MNTGQITLDSKFGRYLYDLCKNTADISVVVEIGTWYGGGSTKCIIDGLVASNRSNLSFVSIESNRKMYDVAVRFWSNLLPSWAKLINGRIIDVAEMDSENMGYQHPDEANWFQEDVQAINLCPNVIDMLPKKIDFLLLDGGEFSTNAEFQKLGSRSACIALDDTNARKCSKIRKYVLENPQDYDILIDDLTDRNGVMVFLNKNII